MRRFSLRVRRTGHKNASMMNSWVRICKKLHIIFMCAHFHLIFYDTFIFWTYHLLRMCKIKVLLTILSYAYLCTKKGRASFLLLYEWRLMIMMLSYIMCNKWKLQYECMYVRLCSTKAWQFWHAECSSKF